MIWEFIKAYKEAYTKVYNNRIIAKSDIKKVKHIIKSYETVKNKAKNIKKLLYDINGFLPIKQRADYVQKTLDLLMYGFDVNASSENGMIGNYRYIETEAKHYLERMEKAFSKHNYKEVNEIYDALDKMIKHNLDIWEIKY